MLPLVLLPTATQFVTSIVSSAIIHELWPDKVNIDITFRS